MNSNNVPIRGRPRLPEKVNRTVKRCCHGLCTNDSKSMAHELTFFNFPLPCLSFRNALPGSEFRRRHKIGDCEKCDKCKRWLHRSRRVGLTMDTIGYTTYICSQHFPSGKNAMIENEEPYPATCSELWKKSKRPPPKPRSQVSTRKRGAREESHADDYNSTELMASTDTGVTSDPDNVKKSIKKIKRSNQEMKITAIWSCRDIFPDIGNVTVTQSTQTDSCPSKFQEMSTQTDFLPDSHKSNSRSTGTQVEISLNQIKKDGKLLMLPNLFKLLPQPRKKEEWTQTDLSYNSATVISKRVDFDVSNLLETMDSSWAFKINDGNLTLIRHSGSTIEIRVRLTASSFDIEVYGHPITIYAVLDSLKVKFVTEGVTNFVQMLQNSATCTGIDNDIVKCCTSKYLREHGFKCNASGRLRSVHCYLLLIEKSPGLCLSCTNYEQQLINLGFNKSTNFNRKKNTKSMTRPMLLAALRAKNRLENEYLRKILFLKNRIAKLESSDHYLNKSID